MNDWTASSAPSLSVCLSICLSLFPTPSLSFSLNPPLLFLYLSPTLSLSLSLSPPPSLFLSLAPRPFSLSLSLARSFAFSPFIPDWSATSKRSHQNERAGAGLLKIITYLGPSDFLCHIALPSFPPYIRLDNDRKWRYNCSSSCCCSSCCSCCQRNLRRNLPKNRWLVVLVVVLHTLRL